MPAVLVSNTVHDHVRDRLPFVFEIWASAVKNIARPVRVYRVAPPAHPAASALSSPHCGRVLSARA
jgi:class 3 adenylate cyclase